MIVGLVFAVNNPVFSAAAEENPGGAAAPASGDAKCEHGVLQRLCARCNPKLAAVYKAKGDWCSEHSRPESQCVVCHPELATKGIK
jgi:hypothetical protein